MKKPYIRPRKHEVQALLAGLMEVLRSRGAEVQWHEPDRRDHFMALVEGDDGLEIHAFVGEEPVPSIGPILVLQALLPVETNSAGAVKYSLLCDQGNLALYGSKIYPRRAPGGADVVQLVIERGVLLGNGDLLRIADEFDMLVAEYAISAEELEPQRPGADALSQARMLGLLEEPLVENC